jgi:hypothetical protein
MSSLNASVAKHHGPIILSLLFVIMFFAAACTIHDVVPVRHYLFGCDHHMHVSG